jgi:hypothetical protein
MVLVNTKLGLAQRTVSIHLPQNKMFLRREVQYFTAIASTVTPSKTRMSSCTVMNAVFICVPLAVVTVILLWIGVKMPGWIGEMGAEEARPTASHLK